MALHPQRLRSAYSSLKQSSLALHLSRFSRAYIPNTTNSCDGSFAHWKSKVKLHRGLSKRRKKWSIIFWKFLKTPIFFPYPKKPWNFFNNFNDSFFFTSNGVALAEASPETKAVSLKDSIKRRIADQALQWHKHLRHPESSQSRQAWIQHPLVLLFQITFGMTEWVNSIYFVLISWWFWQKNDWL